MTSFALWDKFYHHFSDFMPLLPLHEYTCKQLLNNDMDSSPNILVYGPIGFPHMILIEYAIAIRFGATYPIQKRTPVWNNLPYIETDYYVEMDMAHPDFPKNIQEMIDFLLNIIRNRCIYLSRHIIILKNLDILHRSNSQAFRVILERFTGNVLFISTTHHINQLEAPILSRMVSFRIPLPTEEQQIEILHKLTNKKTIRYVDRNIIRNIFFNEASVIKQLKTLPTLTYPPLQDFIDRIYDKDEIRKFAYKLFQQDISISTITMDLISSLSEEEKHAFLKKAADIEQMSCTTDPAKVCFFIEYLLNIYHSYKYNELGSPK